MDFGYSPEDGERFSIADDPPSRAVVQAVASIEGIETLELPPLYESIDPDALDALFRGDADGRITFTYNGYTITVLQNDQVIVQE